MRQKYYCPNCDARLVYGERFCISCGINLTWVVKPIQPQSVPALYSHQNPGQQQKSDQEWPIYNQQPRLYRQYELNEDSFSKRKNSSAGSAVAPISTEISKLLADFGEHLKYKKVS